MTLLPMSMLAQEGDDTFELPIDNLKYVFNKSTQTATVIGFNGTGISELVIPTTVNARDNSGSLGELEEEITYSVTKIGEGAFLNKDVITTVTVGDNVMSIDDYAFSNCDGITSVTLGSKANTIGNQAFARCKSLTTLTIPTSVTSIGDYAFQGCTGLSTLTIPNNVLSIGSNAYGRCLGLTSITIGSSLYANMLKGTLVGYAPPPDSTDLVFDSETMKFRPSTEGEKVEPGKAYLPIEAYGGDALSIKAVEDDSLEGDLNKDGEVNVTDVTILVNRIWGK